MRNRPNRSSSRFRRLVINLALACMAAGAWSGCAALLLLGGTGTSAIAFATGELSSTEEVSLDELDHASAVAVERLGYEEIVVTREADRIRVQAVTAGGDPVDIHLLARGPERTDLRIRIGVFGDETASRLVLEEIHQSL